MKSVIICDMEGVIENLNKDAEKLFGYQNSELIGKKRVSIFSEGEIVLQNVLMWLKKANKDGFYETKTNFIKKDGTKFAAKIRITPNFSNGKNKPQTGYCGMTEPIDENINIPISFITKIIKGVAITRAGFGSASILPIFAVAAFFAGSDLSASSLSLLFTVSGILSNEFRKEQIEISSGDNYFDLAEGEYHFQWQHFQQAYQKHPIPSGVIH